MTAHQSLSLPNLAPSPCGRGWRPRRRVRGSCRKNRIIDHHPDTSAISQGGCAVSPQMPRPRCGGCSATGDLPLSSFVGRYRSRAIFWTLSASKGAWLSRSMAASTRYLKAIPQQVQPSAREAVERCATGTTTCCISLRPYWRTSLQSSPRGKIPLTRRLTS